MQNSERQIIRELAKQYMELANSDGQMRANRRMKDSNDLSTNTFHANLNIFSVPYIKCTDGTTLMGDTQGISLMGILKALEEQWTSLAITYTPSNPQLHSKT